MSRPGTRGALAALAFAAAAACFGLGLAGRLSPWVAAELASLALLTIGFYLASDHSVKYGANSRDSERLS